MFDAPESDADLLARAQALTGRTLAEIARVLERTVPSDPARSKGWIGELLETALGASAGNLPQPDFLALGVELKSIPIARGRPRESTFVCSAALAGEGAGWAASRVRHKLAKVLWIPVDADGALPDRRVGAARLWSPDPDDERLLAADWEELDALLRLGQHWEIEARRGRALQLRPKAADGRATTWALDEGGEWIRAKPLGYYLRASFTARILGDPR